jgi:NAD(P)H dehydrogenase (quinone)
MLRYALPFANLNNAGKRYLLSVEALTMTEAAQILSEELDKIITYEPLPAADMRSLPIGQTMEPAYFECIVRQMELLQAGKLPDFADVYQKFGLKTPSTSPMGDLY